MARRSKTKVGGGPRQEPMLHAAEAGQQAVQRAQEQGTAQEERSGRSSREQIQRGAKSISDTAIRKEEMESQLADRQAGRQQQQAQFESSQEQSAQQATEQTDLRAAEQGMQRDPEFARREADLKAEMERGERQATKPGELEGSRFVPTESSEAESRSDRYQDAYKLETERMRIEAQRSSTMQRASTALRKGDEVAYKGEKERYAQMGQRIASRADKIIKANLGDGTVSKDDVAYLRRLAEQNPNPELQKEIASGELGPHAARFLRGKVIADGLEFVSQTGDWPDMELIDISHPVFAEFQRHVMEANQDLQRRQQYGAFMGITSLRDANRMKNKAAAVAMMSLDRAKTNSRVMGGGGSQPLPSSPQPGGQNDGSQQPGAGSPVTPVARPEPNAELAPPSAALGR